MHPPRRATVTPGWEYFRPLFVLGKGQLASLSHGWWKGRHYAPFVVSLNSRKRLIKWDTCGCLFHLSCVGLTRAQAEAFWRWNCEHCRGVERVPAKAETPPIDLVGYIGRCHHSLKVLNRIPKGVVIPVADALQRLIREALDRGSEIAWSKLLCFSYLGAWVSPVEWGKFRFQS